MEVGNKEYKLISECNSMTVGNRRIQSLLLEVAYFDIGIPSGA